MAIPPEMSGHLDAWVGSFPSPWWIYFRLRARGYLSREASGATVRRVLREVIQAERSRRRRLDGEAPFLGASWNTEVPGRFLEEKLLSPKGETMARWRPGLVP